MNNSVAGVLSRKKEIMKKAIGIDYAIYEESQIAFDYEKMMADHSYPIEEVKNIQINQGVGQTPLKELKQFTQLARVCAPKGKGARIFIKDEALNDSGSFKARRAALSCYHAKRLGYPGIIAATSGNYGAAVASQAAKLGLPCIIVQECYDSKGIGQPEIIEKARACEAYGAEVIQLSVGPELFYTFLCLLEETGYFNASLYTPYGILGIETLGMEVVEDCLRLTNRLPDMVICTNAGGGNLTGTARGIKRITNQKIETVGASINLKGLHMASDIDFNRKSFTTGHTGFGMPFMIQPDRSDVPRSAARPLRYIDRYVTLTQGEVFFVTEMLPALEGIERGPAGNTALAAAFSLAQELNEDQIIIVQETEYTGAGKHHQAQLSFARENGIDILFGDPKDEIPGRNIILPKDPTFIQAREVDLDHIRLSYLNANLPIDIIPTENDIRYLMAELNLSRKDTLQLIQKRKETKK
ncbi:MAG: 2-amino-4-oxopentanoate thiolase subunit OrtB [Bacilli bacterium]|jgi:threonine dehydratase|nr:2-amino-4-oxopentanoate thiolase subunit OrtB [Bacilli bacterium]